jgi:hypothetical protein
MCSFLSNVKYFLIAWPIDFKPYDFKVAICFNKGFGILVLVAKFHVFLLQFWHLNMPIGVELHGLNLMEDTSFFFVV